MHIPNLEHLSSMLASIVNTPFFLRVAPVAGALLLDVLIGDPVFALHPVRLIGKLAACSEHCSRYVLGCTWKEPQIFTQASLEHEENKVLDPATRRTREHRKLRERIAGVLAWCMTTLPVAGLALMAHLLAARLGILWLLIVDMLIIWASFALKDLAKHAYAVRDGLRIDGTRVPTQGRRAVSLIVGRDTERLDAEGVARACIESIAESSVDSVASPLLYALLLGPWAAFLYRAINTMDSMFGHKNNRYIWFGTFAARADDAANYLPARFSSAIACLCAPFVGGTLPKAFASFFLYRRAHASPNSGHPEAAYAGALNLKLGGTTWYKEEVAEKPVINPQGKTASEEDIARALKLLYWNTAIILILAAIIMWYLFSI